MALRKPIVLVDGHLEQLQSGDTLDAAVVYNNTVTLTNSNATVALKKGQPVYASGSDSCDLAKADAAGTSKPIGFVADDSIAASATGNIQTDGVISATDWTDATGAATLTAGAVYYLDESAAGKMTTTAPTSGYVTELGVALSEHDFAIDIKMPIKL